MSCARVSLLTNVTRPPAATVTDLGDTPLDVMVIVASLDGVGEGEGVGVGVGAGDGELGVLPPPPQDTAVTTSTTARHERRGVGLRIRRTSLKC
jgi:hypothetical protein